MARRVRGEEEVTLSIVTGDGRRKDLTMDPASGEVYDAEGNAGASIAELAEQPGWDMRVKAAQMELTYDVVVDTEEVPLLASTLKVPSFEIGVRGQWLQGQKVTLEIEVEIDDVNFVPLRARRSSAPYGMERQHIGLKPERPRNAE